MIMERFLLKFAASGWKGSGKMNLLLDPNVAYLLLVAGSVLVLLALLSPGTGILEAAALVILVLAGYSLASLPINIWALLLLVGALYPFWLAVRRKKQVPYLLLAIAALVVGSVFMFRGADGSLSAVHPALAGVVSVLVVLLLWLVARRGLEAVGIQPAHSLDPLIGMEGEVRASFKGDGAVYVRGEEWTARCPVMVKSGTRVRVVGREGLVLLVTPVEADPN
ncbi:hypothetical protein ADN01_09995 [Levilinea saccharolytica]|jgi:membrane-bound serine protease (ClpP class)|uniref:Uncharacterized protein n=2 Tax=Levilinea saccharolytica TaxID=229921 RepID=A0A0P6XZ17_9CHLR|nr:hypothetical protein ADN01_09995 [Levilinea saccharolytica]